MSNSQEQSLDEDAVFLPVNETSPEFIYCEKERQAVERLLGAGPEAFYSSIGTERSSCFLSSEEVSQISSWGQDYHVNQLQAQRGTHGETGGSGTEDFCSTYLPTFSDTPTPDLQLGWPEKSPWLPKESITVHTSPPAEGEPPVREIIRWHLQNASRVIAIVTDSLTDYTIIADLYDAANRGVPVYIILNQRSIQENFTPNRLRHPNMQVRVLGGKTFCSRTGRMVVGEMKEKFLLVDLEIVIHGSYSLTWTDAHLHRQLITVLGGPIVDSFDKEFRILFAASSPVTDTCRIAETSAEGTHRLNDFSNLRFQKHRPLEAEIGSPPSPPTDSLLDWEAMGVVQRDLCFPDFQDQQKEIVPKEKPLQNNMLFDKNTSFVDSFTYNGNQFVEAKRVNENTSPVTNNKPDMSTTINKIQPFLTNMTTPEKKKREEGLKERAVSRDVFIERSTNLDDRTTTRFDDEATEPKHNIVTLSPTMKSSRKAHFEETILDKQHYINETSSKVENIPSSRKPLILRVPQSESFNSLNDLMKRLSPQQSSSGLLKRGSRTTVPELSQSMMELNVHKKDTNDVPVPRFKTPCLDLNQMTPAFALMKKRNNDLKSVLYSSPKNFAPTERPRSTSYNLDWRRSLAEMDGDYETGVRK